MNAYPTSASAEKVISNTRLGFTGFVECPLLLDGNESGRSDAVDALAVSRDLRLNFSEKWF